MTAARSRSQVAAPGARTRGMVQNTALDASLGPGEAGAEYFMSGVDPAPPDMDPDAALRAGYSVATSALPGATSVSPYAAPIQVESAASPRAPLVKRGAGGLITDTTTPVNTVMPVGTMMPVNTTMPRWAGTTTADTNGGSGGRWAGTTAADTIGGSAMPQGGRWSSNYEWEGPEAANVASGSAGNMLGFNTAGWGSGERGTDSFKNTFGKIASRYEAKPSSLDAIINDPDFKSFFPNARIVGFDKIDFGDGNAVDVLVSADPTADTAQGWSFQTGAPGSAGGSGAGSPGSAGGAAFNPKGGLTIDAYQGSDRVNQILAYLMQQLSMDKALG